MLLEIGGVTVVGSSLEDVAQLLKSSGNTVKSVSYERGRERQSALFLIHLFVAGTKTALSFSIIFCLPFLLTPLYLLDANVTQL